MDFCQDYFGIDDGKRALLESPLSDGYFAEMWGRLGKEMYEHPDYMLRQEIWRSWDVMGHNYEDVLSELPHESCVLDYGCGTGEYARRACWDRGVSGILFEPSAVCRDYLRWKYKDAPNVRIVEAGFLVPALDVVICTDVLEHILNPVEVTSDLTHWLKPGGKAIFHFSMARDHAGHLKESIDQAEAWMGYIQRHYRLLEDRRGCLLLEKL